MSYRFVFDHKAGDLVCFSDNQDKDKGTSELGSFTIEVPLGDATLIVNPAKQSDFENYSFARDSETMKNVRGGAWNDEKSKDRLEIYEYRWENGNPYSGMLISLKDKQGNLKPMGHFVYGGADKDDVAKITGKDAKDVTVDDVAKYGEIAVIIDKNYQNKGVLKSLVPALTSFYKGIVPNESFRSKFGIVAPIKENIIATASPDNPALRAYVQKMNVPVFIKGKGEGEGEGEGVGQERLVFSAKIGQHELEQFALQEAMKQTIGMTSKDMYPGLRGV